MASKTHTTAVVIVPPESVWEPIQEIRRVHDRRFRRWMPHINLIYPFRPPGEFPELVPRFERACREVRPWRLRLDHLRTFRHRGHGYTIWLQPAPPEPMAALRQTMARVVPDCDELERFPGGFTPHLSIGQVRGEAALEDLMADLEKGWRSLAFDVEAICFIRRDRPPRDIFEIAERIPLGSSVVC